LKTILVFILPNPGPENNSSTKVIKMLIIYRLTNIAASRDQNPLLFLMFIS